MDAKTWEKITEKWPYARRFASKPKFWLNATDCGGAGTTCTGAWGQMWVREAQRGYEISLFVRPAGWIRTRASSYVRAERRARRLWTVLTKLASTRYTTRVGMLGPARFDRYAHAHGRFVLDNAAPILKGWKSIDAPGAS